MLARLSSLYSFPANLFFRLTKAPLCALVLIVFSFTVVFAEGSKELNANGGYRAYLLSSNTGNDSFPFPTWGTMKVYVKAGESIYVGSSAQGDSLGTINLRAPDGSTYTSGNSTSAGLIANYNQELAGPLPNAGGYTPFIVKAGAGQEGVWEVDFISQSGGVDLGNPDPVASNAPWIQPQGQYVTAFDVSVRNLGNSQFVPGRVFTNVFSGILGAFNVGFNAIFYILTSDGYQYTLNNNGQAGDGFTFFVNNKGFLDAKGNALYESVAEINNPDVQDPRSPDTLTNITQKIFFNTPAADLPASAITPEGTTTWLLTKPQNPAVQNVGFTGNEGSSGKAGTYPLGSAFTFSCSAAGTYQLAIDVNQNSVYNDPVDRVITGNALIGTNTVSWNGLDGKGNPVPADPNKPYNAQITLVAKAGEVHFPFFDVERNFNGIIVTRINGNRSPDDTIYWNDTPIPLIGTPSNPIKNLTGISSLINGHKWGSPTNNPGDQNDFGNNVGIDTWGYTYSNPVYGLVAFELQQADLAVDSLTSVANCPGQPVTYTVVVKNSGPSAVSGAVFSFNFPAQVTGVNVTSAATRGSSSVSGGTVSNSVYNADIDMAAGAERTFTINGVLASKLSGGIDVTAAMLRPADVTDPDATNPADTTAPTNPVVECNAPPSGNGCNNIKTVATNYIPAPDAGPGQPALLHQTVTLQANEAGQWSQAAGDPDVAIIAHPADPTTTVTGLNTQGIYHFVFTNASGCMDTTEVSVNSADMIIPNIFTPNGDGKNDLFVIKGLASYPGSQLLVFNRWGNEVYQSDDYQNNWDGGGLAEGTYYYVLNRREPGTNAITPFKGWIFLKRSK